MLDQLNELISTRRAAFETRHPGVLARAPLERALRLADDGAAGLSRPSYSHVNPELASLLTDLGGRGSPASSAYHQLLLLALIQARASAVASSSSLTDTVKGWYVKNYTRILDEAAAQRPLPEFYHHSVDAYLKDLGVCSGRIIPAGVQKLNRYDMPVRGLRRERLGRILTGLWCVARMGGTGPVFDMHTDSHDADLMAEFTPEGWRRFYLTVAGLMERQPDVRGLFGIGWFFDPQLAEVSPRLDYLRELVAESGGHLFNMGANEGARESALATSPTRRALHEAGRYEPTNYMALWDRHALLQWASRANALDLHAQKH
jgi:hypothetical protein